MTLSALSIIWIIVACLLWLASLWLLMSKWQIASPAASYVALFVLSLAKRGPFQLLPINGTILIGWLCMTVVVMMAVVLQDPAVSRQRRGSGYMTVGAIAGMLVGLLAYTFTADLSMRYGLMVVATVAGTFFGFLFYTNTPRGRDVALPTGRFFKYLLAKGFPVAISVMMIGVALVLAIALNTVDHI